MLNYHRFIPFQLDRFVDIKKLLRSSIIIGQSFWNVLIISNLIGS